MRWIAVAAMLAAADGAVAASGEVAPVPPAPPATAAVSTLDLLAALPLPTGAGRGRVDGQDLDVRVVTGAATIDEMLEALRATFGGKRTLTLMPGEPVAGVLVSDVRSPQCPSCSAPTPATLRAIMDDSIVLTFVEAPGVGLIGFASNVSRTVGRTQAGPRPYEGARLAPVAGSWTTLSQSRFEFGGTSVSSAVVRPKHGAALAAIVGAELERHGFKRLGPEAREGALGARPGDAWQKDNAVVSIDPANDDEVVINEVQVQ
jgi:hypothetical protein